MSLAPKGNYDVLLAPRAPLRTQFLALLFSQGFSQIVTAANGLLAVWLLVPSDYSRYSLAATGLNICAIISDAGLTAYIGRETARLSDEKGVRLWQQALRQRLLLSVCTWLIWIGLALWFPPVGDAWLIVLAGLALCPLAISTLATACIIGQGRATLVARLSAAIVTLSGVLMLGALLSRSVPLMLVTNFVATCAGAGIYYLALRKVARPVRSSTSDFPAFALIKASVSFMGINLASIAFQYADIYLVSALLGTAAVGQYSLALRLFTLVILVPTVWGNAAVPRFARHPEKTAELRRWGWYLTAAGVACGVLGLFSASPAIRLIFGARYAASGAIFTILLWAAAGIFASAAPVTWLTVTNRQKWSLVALVIADIAGIVMVLFFVLVLGAGLEGVALARVGTTWLLCGLYIGFGVYGRNTQTEKTSRRERKL